MGLQIPALKADLAAVPGHCSLSASRGHKLGNAVPELLYVSQEVPAANTSFKVMYLEDNQEKTEWKWKALYLIGKVRLGWCI